MGQKIDLNFKKKTHYIFKVKVFLVVSEFQFEGKR